MNWNQSIWGRGQGRGRGDNARGRGTSRGGNNRGYAWANQASVSNPWRGTNRRGGGNSGNFVPENQQRGRGRARPDRHQRPPDNDGGSIIFQPEPYSPPFPSQDVTIAENLIVQRQVPSLESLTISEDLLPRRPDYGSVGRPIVLRTNYFEISLHRAASLHRYVVTFQPDVPNKRRKRRLFEILLKDHPLFKYVTSATDYTTTIITALKISVDHVETGVISYYEEGGVPSKNGDRGHKFTITYRRAVQWDELTRYLANTNPEASIEFKQKESTISDMNIVFSYKANNERLNTILAGTKFYPRGKESYPLGGGLVARRGYFSSVRTSTIRLLVNVNICTAPFYQEGTVKDLMDAFGTDRKDQLEGFLKNLQVQLKYLKGLQGRPRIRTITGLAPHPQRYCNATGASFNCPQMNNKIITVEQYFAQVHHINLKFPLYPLVNIGRSGEKPALIPPELIDVLSGQAARRQLSAAQADSIREVACRKPSTNARDITSEGLRVLGFIDDVSRQGPAAYGFDVVPQMVAVPARILPIPCVAYRHTTVDSNPGSWKRDHLTKFVKGGNLFNWSFLAIHYNEPWRSDPGELTRIFSDMLRKTGMTVSNPYPPQGYYVEFARHSKGKDPTAIDDGNRAALYNEMTKVAAQGTQMLLVFLPFKDATNYGHVKSLGDVEFGISTICAVMSKIKKGREDTFFANIAMKANLKRGGTNHIIPPDKLDFVLREQTMLMGIDVTHPSPGTSKDAPSIAGVVASIDSDYSQYPGSILCQTGGKEMVTGLTSMVTERLRLYQKTNNFLPTRIIVYRDGVAEFQFRTVLKEELPCIELACQTIYPQQRQQPPKITIIICSKRHHTRFFPTAAPDADKNGNCHNGTVVDRAITFERKWDFFLQAHHCIQGTARPCHYIVIHDENGFTSNRLEQLTHSLCYLFGRATTAVSLCPPAYYADLICDRARFYLRRTMLPVEAGGGRGYDERRDWKGGVHERLEGTMYYI
ncbi:MAG: hypothetical protein M1834_003564 [Cirrosporium novae-zelandiae]|nr:MAG: hypothetical protein M1834_003564 [Cirrosporium novae-zelandiae]